MAIDVNQTVILVLTSNSCHDALIRVTSKASSQSTRNQEVIRAAGFRASAGVFAI